MKAWQAVDARIKPMIMTSVASDAISTKTDEEIEQGQ